MSQYEIFCGDPALLSYFARHLQEPSWKIIKEEESYYLYSSDIEALENSANLKRDADGLLSVFNLLSPNFQALRADEKVEIGVQGLLFTLNGVIKLKYKMPGFTRVLTISPSQVRTGIVSKKDNSGRVVKTTAKSISIRFCLTVGEDFLLAADIWWPTLSRHKNRLR